MKLLIVEDEVRLADLLRKGLTEEGHSATCAFDGVEGLALAQSYEFDVIILDIMLPKLNGYEFAKRLRAEKVRTPILMLTAKRLGARHGQGPGPRRRRLHDQALLVRRIGRAPARCEAPCPGGSG